MRYDNVTPYDKMNLLFKECNEPYYRDIAKGLYYTGARIGELVQITQQDITISKENSNFIEVKLRTEKNPHSPYRFIPININSEPDALDIFIKNKEPESLLFPKYNSTILDTSFMRVIRRKFNEFWPGVAPHYFRHCRLTHCITDFDFNDQELVKYAGWTDSKPARWYVSLKTTDLQRKMGDK